MPLGRISTTDARDHGRAAPGHVPCGPGWHRQHRQPDARRVASRSLPVAGRTRCRRRHPGPLPGNRRLRAGVVRTASGLRTSTPTRNRGTRSSRPRYVVFHRGNAEQSTHQEYVGRRGMQVRPGVRVSPRHPCVNVRMGRRSAPVDSRRVFGVAQPVSGISAPPTRRSACVFERPCPRQRRQRTCSGLIPEAPWKSASPRPVTCASSTPCMTNGWTMAHAWPVLSFRRFAIKSATGRQSRRHRTMPARSPLWLRLGVPVSGRRVTPITTLFKQAVLSRHQAIHGEPPSLLHGHGFKGSGYELARFLALPDVGFRRSRGRIHGLALWLPPGCDTVMRQRIRDAAYAVRRLTGRGIDVAVAPRDDEKRPRAADPSPLDAAGALLDHGLSCAARAPRSPRSA